MLSFEHKYVNESTIMTIITNLPNKNSCGFDGLSTTILKSIKGIIIKPLTLIINQIFDTGVFPANLKIAKIIPIFKKDDNNYRPISLLPIISKVVEKVISDQLNELFVKHKLLFDHQYGFRSGHSTEHAALELTDRIITNIDNKKSPLNIFLDLSKAFDTLDHKILLDKLHHCGIRETPLKLLKSYLSNRQQFVEVKETRSETLPMVTGIPQCSILGPLLFLIYINDFLLSSKRFHFIMYADDTTLSSTIDSFNEDSNKNITSEINNELYKINEWLKINKLSLNKSKTKYMISKKRQANIVKPILQIDGINIESVDHFNFLGLTVDSRMT